MTNLRQIDVTLHCSECGPVVHPLSDETVTARVTATALEFQLGDNDEVHYQTRQAWDRHMRDHTVAPSEVSGP